MRTNEPGRALAPVEQPRLEIAATDRPGRAIFLPENFAQAMQMADLMARGLGVRPWMRGKPEACFMVLQQAMRWGMDPYAVANKAYETNGTVAYEAQLVAAVINTSGEILGRLKIEWEGEPSKKAQLRPPPRRRENNNDPRDPRNEPQQAWTPPDDETLVCRVSGRIKSDPDDLKVLEQELRTITVRNSPLWQTNPKLQLAYHATRSWARLYTPEILLGVYTPDELADGLAAEIEAQSTPAGGRAPDRRDYIAGTVEERPDDAEPGERIGEDTQFEEIQPLAVDETEERPETPSDDDNGGDLPAMEAENASEEAETPVAEEDSAVSDDDTVSPGGSDGVDTESDDDAEPIADAEVPLSQESDIPVEPLEWAAWERETTAEILEIGDAGAFNRLRQRIQPILDQADDALLTRIQDMLADKLVTLPEPEKKA